MALSWLNALGGVLAVTRVNAKYRGVPEAIAQALAERLRELPLDNRYRLNAHGPVLDIKWQGGGTTSFLGLALIERGTPDEKLTKVFEVAGKQLQNVVRNTATERPADGLRAVSTPEFEPHVRVTEAEVLLWWGAASPEGAPVCFRPIPRSELGL